jgi:hypothetical protein
MFPTSYRYTWRSAHVGDDTVAIDYTAPHYCSDCYYVVGVYGYRSAVAHKTGSGREMASARDHQALP